MAGHGIDASLVVFAVSLLIGGFAIHVGSIVAFASRNYSHAVLTALLGALAWAVVDFGLSELGISGLPASVAGLLVWIYVVRLRYSVGWIRAGIVAAGAWLAALFVLVLFAALGIGNLEAFGVPGL
ncbi:hypothetical protein [Halobacteriaceae bacterium SHR40]|uniref:hypothetical protein n=1 Tax=Halovenus amylolytica TaxID=2500550 RepID=UPI000FE2DFB8